jgi:hypothetical protein
VPVDNVERDDVLQTLQCADEQRAVSLTRQKTGLRNRK